MNRLKKHSIHYLQVRLLLLSLCLTLAPLQWSHAEPKAGISLQEATDTALKQFGGEVIKSESNKQNGTSVYVIRLLSNGRVKEVHIDSQSGKVIAPNKE